MNNSSSTAMDTTSFLMLIALAAVWGGTFFFAEIALTEIPPLTITFHRVVWALPFLILIVWIKKLSIPTSPKTWGAYLIMGALNNAIPFSLIFWGQTQISGGLASILNATTAMFAAVVAGIVLKDEPLTTRKMAGAILGILGVGVIMGPNALTEFNPANLAQLAVLAATLSYAFAGAWGKISLSQHPPLVNALGMIAGSTILMLPLTLVVEGEISFSMSVPVWSSLIAMASLSTALAYFLYFAILTRAGASNLLLVTLLIPAFAIALGTVFLDESMGANVWTGFAVISLGFAVTDGRLFAKLRN